MQEFYIKQNATLPVLSMDLILDGRHDFNKCYDSLQNADVFFSMKNFDTGVYALSKAKASVKEKESDSCTEEYAICYEWKERDTKRKGHYIGTFEVVLHDDLSSDGKEYPNGKLIVPIREELEIFIQ